MGSDSRPSKRRRVSNPDLDPEQERRESPSPTRTRKTRKNNIPATEPESTANAGTEEVAEKKDDEAPSQSTRRSARIKVTGNSVVSTSAGPPRPRVVEEEDTQNRKRSRKTKTSIAGSSSTKKLARKSSKPTAATTTTTTTTTTGRKNKKEDKQDERDGRLKGKKEKKGVSGTDDVWEVPCDRENEDEDELAIAQLVANDAAMQLQTELEVPPETVNQPAYAEEFISLCEEHGLEPMLAPLGEFILEKLNGKRLIPLKGLDNEYRTVFQLLEQTVVAGEGNSLLLLGARGSGKTAVVNTALAALSKTNADDFHIVRLNGFLHTDDKVALREIWQQLGREIDPQDDLEKPSSYADTMASLLALLSHPEEITGPLPEENGMTTTKSVVIVLDEFDLFSYHPRQTLLYNLFDIAQAKKAPVAVLGLTTKVEVTENLEKRVKSRFSHRRVFLPRPRSFVEFVDICMASLKIEGDEVDSCPLDGEKGPILLKGWNNYIQDLFEDAEFARHLEPIYYRSKSVRDFFRSALVPITSMALGSVAGTKAELPGTQSFASNSLACPDPAPLPFTQLSGSSSNVSLPLSLLLTATRLTALHESTATATATAASLSLSFAAVYSEYVRLLTVAKASASASGAAATPGRVWGKEAAKEAWEKLVDWGLVLLVNGYGMGDGKMFRVEVSFEEAVAALGSTGAGALGRWWRDG
ncbi:TPA_exp: putative Origin recognition complex subunit Orc4 [Trichophyton benhamiae CBS 112371]|uniref:Origin recognition complex subunit 4 n=1 Tax=Arthroderma benhamiae (strain ATCC MYA-4681 / CBS 112371) TaxID=663331 RepID=D4AYZ1_ARTBC|nr:origin recognition complex subunit Orc4, putative [Trichophyton benhamiae CBS 112371]EFE31811.1 origin recognition complex subunit Orc4, putative [Trichophyton benhamiae CBS 112371]DAA74933.1 TPA_exp: putative Origin recognition complex subunit Orc4 [Trichophyton benhamiae CBS 112371]